MHDTNAAIITKIFSRLDFGVISPYPIVHIVTIAK